MPKTAVKEKFEAPWFGSFTPAREGGEPLPLPPLPEEPEHAHPGAIDPIPATYPAGPTYESVLLNQLTALDATVFAQCFFKNSDQTLAEGVDIAVGTVTGSQIGTAPGQKLALWGGTPTTQPANSTEIVAVLTALGARASGGNPNLDLGTGSLSVGLGSFSGVVAGSAAGAGTPFQLKSATVTPSADADYTLTAPELSCLILSLVAGLWTAGHSILLPTGFAGGIWHISNTSGFTATIKPTGGTGINIANGRAAWIRTNGTNARRMTADIDPSA